MSDPTPDSTPEYDRPNQIYYFAVGAGDWTGRFLFRISNWRVFIAAKLGLLNKSLCILMHVMGRWVGPPQNRATMIAYPERGEGGVATNDIRLSRFCVPIYRQVIEYHLDPGGQKVTVVGWERYGPIPRLLQHDIEHWGSIGPDGLSADYRIPMLGGE